MDNRGVSVLEILLSISIISLVLVLFFGLFGQLKDQENNLSANSNYLMNQATITEYIEEDIIDYGLMYVLPCSYEQFLSESSAINLNYGFACVNFIYPGLIESTGLIGSSDYIASLLIFRQYNNVNGTDPNRDSKWVVSYQRGYYSEWGSTSNNDILSDVIHNFGYNEYPKYNTWVSTKKINREYPDDLNITKTPYVDSYRGTEGTITIPILDSKDKRYDIVLSFGPKNMSTYGGCITDPSATSKKLQCYLNQEAVNNFEFDLSDFYHAAIVG